MKKVIILQRHTEDLTKLKRILNDGNEFFTTDIGEAIAHIPVSEHCVLITGNIFDSGHRGGDVLQMARRKNPSCKVILFSGVVRNGEANFFNAFIEKPLTLMWEEEAWEPCMQKLKEACNQD